VVRKYIVEGVNFDVLRWGCCGVEAGRVKGSGRGIGELLVEGAAKTGLGMEGCK